MAACCCTQSAGSLPLHKPCCSLWELSKSVPAHTNFTFSLYVHAHTNHWPFSRCFGNTWIHACTRTQDFYPWELGFEVGATLTDCPAWAGQTSPWLHSCNGYTPQMLLWLWFLTMDTHKSSQRFLICRMLLSSVGGFISGVWLVNGMLNSAEILYGPDCYEEYCLTL